MQIKMMALVAPLLIILASGCASSPAGTSPREGSMNRSAGASADLSPLAPAEATKVQKVGDHWTCELNGRTMVYNNATSRWEPQQK